MSRRKGCAYIWERKDTRVLWLCRYVNKKPVRVSTGLPDTKQNRLFLNRNAESEFWRIALEQGKVEPDQIPNNSSLSIIMQQDPAMPKLREYGEYTLNATLSGRSTKTQQDVKKKFNRICLYFGDETPINSITATMIAEWQTKLSQGKVSYQNGKPYSNKTIINYRSVLNTILSAAVDDGLIQRNPMESRIAKAPRIIKKIPTVYSLEEIRALLESCRHYAKNARNFQTEWAWKQMFYMLKLGFFTGLRSGELIALQWHDINFDQNYIHVQRRIRDGDEDLPKGYKKRFVDLLPQAKEVLKTQQLLTGLKSKWVWLTYQGNPYSSTDSLDEMFKKACRHAGVKVGKFYNMRHSFATLMIENGMSESWLIQNTGHVDISTTRDYYFGKIKPNLDAINKLVV
ncbi:tyrosine-type recombinase/integrase [Hydrogenimonas thermophila]|uniref:Site-specific recombinase XerD n=1 Tax=Hydrogenimonas thermophila TaxID=223786 RepID=A0A1I5LYW8_9BACT|nr:site-specific integrase [Hydrogenimonas thermophila]SFP02544.1 Site-specific recombinase XerD [Hydrogenimonas thermophila]